MDIRHTKTTKVRIHDADLGEGNLEGYFCIPTVSKIGRTDFQPDYDFAVGVTVSGALVAANLFYALDPAFPTWEGRRSSAPDMTFLWPLAVSGLTDVVATMTVLVVHVTRALDSDTGVVTVEIA